VSPRKFRAVVMTSAKFTGGLPPSRVPGEWKSRDRRVLNLANNELQHEALESYIRAAWEVVDAEDFRAYPDYSEYRSKFASIYNRPEGEIGFAAGSDQIYKNICQYFANGRRRFWTTDPNYSGLFLYAELSGIQVERSRYRDGFELIEFLEFIKGGRPGDLVSISNPNGPTGACWTRSELTLLEQQCFEAGMFLVLDEVYSAFDTYSVCPRPLSENALTVHSFSKSHGMAGGRVAVYASTSPRLIAGLQTGNPTNPVSGVSLKVALSLLQMRERFEAIWRDVSRSREVIAAALPTIVDCQAKYSRGNFATFQFSDTSEVERFVQRSFKAGFGVRDLAKFGLAGYARVTCADEALMTRFLTAIG